MNQHRFWEELSRDGVVGAAAVLVVTLLWHRSPADVVWFWIGWMVLSFVFLIVRTLRRQKSDADSERAE